jgi:uncharacterized membrane protein YpjA
MLSYIGEVNWLAVIVCAVLSMVIGFIWYGPLFSKPWVKLLARPKSRLLMYQRIRCLLATS